MELIASKQVNLNQPGMDQTLMESLNWVDGKDIDNTTPKYLKITKPSNLNTFDDSWVPSIDSFDINSGADAGDTIVINNGIHTFSLSFSSTLTQEELIKAILDKVLENPFYTSEKNIQATESEFCSVYAINNKIVFETLYPYINNDGTLTVNITGGIYIDNVSSSAGTSNTYGQLILMYGETELSRVDMLHIRNLQSVANHQILKQFNCTPDSSITTLDFHFFNNALLRDYEILVEVYQ